MIRIPSTPKEINRRNADLSPQASEAHGYVAADLGDGDVVILTTVPKVYARASSPQPVVAIEARIAVESIVGEALVPRHDDAGILIVPGKIVAGNNLHLDTRKLVPSAHAEVFKRLVGPVGARPAEVDKRLRRMVTDIKRLNTRKNDEGTVEGVSAPTEILDGDRRWLADTLAGGIDEDEVNYRIQQYILSRLKPAKKTIKRNKTRQAPLGAPPTLEEFMQMVSAA